MAYKKNECSDKTYGLQSRFWLAVSSTPQGLFRYSRCASCTCLVICKSAKKWYAVRLCVPLSWNTIALSQSNCRNFSCSSIVSKIFKIIAEIPNSQYCSDICFLWTIGLCRINAWGYTEIWPFWKKVSSRVRLELLVYTQTKKQINRLTVFLFAK